MGGERGEGWKGKGGGRRRGSNVFKCLGLRGGGGEKGVRDQSDLGKGLREWIENPLF